MINASFVEGTMWKSTSRAVQLNMNYPCQRWKWNPNVCTV